MLVTVNSESSESYRQIISAGENTVFSDLPTTSGGEGTAVDPYDLLLGAWGACTNMTLQMYANRKQWTLEKVSTQLEKIQNDKTISLKKKISIWGAFTPEQLERLKVIAEKCPVNQLITNQANRPTIESKIEWMGQTNTATLGSL